MEKSKSFFIHKGLLLDARPSELLIQMLTPSPVPISPHPKTCVGFKGTVTQVKNKLCGKEINLY